MGTSSIEISKYCRLCACETDTGFTIFDDSEDKASLDILINKYLPIKVYNDGKLPGQICQLCQNGVAATVDLIDRMVEGQQRLRMILQNEILPLDEGTIDSTTLINLQGDAPDILMDDLVKGSDIQKVYDDSHVMSFAVAGTNTNQGKRQKGRSKQMLNESFPVFEPPSLLDMAATSSDLPLDDLGKVGNMADVFRDSGLLELEATEAVTVKKKRGRPRKSATAKEVNNDVVNQQLLTKSRFERPKRKINLPTRFRDTVEGKEFEDPKELSKSESLDKDMFQDNLMKLTPTDVTEYNNNEGTSIILSPDNTNQQSKLPDAVNIEVEFKEERSQFLDELYGTDSYSNATISVPSVSYVKVEEQETSKILEELEPPTTAVFTKKRGRQKKAKCVCDICGKEFLYKGRYDIHMRLHRSVTFQCNECKEKFTTKQDLETHHKDTGHGGLGIIKGSNVCKENEFKCPFCPIERIFFSKKSYNNHIANSHKGQKPYSCKICGKRFSYRHSLRSHATLHESLKQEKKYSCDMCDKVFHHPTSLIYHKDSGHNNGRLYVCHSCGASFKHKLLLQRHHTVHSKIRPYKCSICSMAFKTKSNLHNHQNTHSSLKKYTCEKCGKSFNYITSLTLHIRAHTGERPYKCEVCGNSFSQKGNLKEHIRIHTGEKPYCCHTCGKKFTTSSQFKAHTKKHKLDQTYKCKICFKDFRNKELWQSHQLKHKEELAYYSCLICNKIFSDQNSLKKHSKLHQDRTNGLEKDRGGSYDNNEFFMMTTVLDKSKLPEQSEDTSMIFPSKKPQDDQQQIIYIFSKVDEGRETILQNNTQELEVFDASSSTQNPKILEFPVVPKNFQTFALEAYNEGSSNANATMPIGTTQAPMLTHEAEEAIIPVLESDAITPTFLNNPQNMNVSTNATTDLPNTIMTANGNTLDISLKSGAPISIVIPDNTNSSLYNRVPTVI